MDATELKFEWGERGNQILVDNTGKTVSKQSYYGWQSVYSQDYYRSSNFRSDRILFRVKINSSANMQIRFGIVNNTYYKNTHFCRSNTKTPGATYYGFDSGSGNIISSEFDNDWKSPSKSLMAPKKEAICNVGDVIVFELNFFEKCIKYYKNGALVGKLFKKISTSKKNLYHFAVSIVDEQDSVTLEQCMALPGDSADLPLFMPLHDQSNDHSRQFSSAHSSGMQRPEMLQIASVSHRRSSADRSVNHLVAAQENHHHSICWSKIMDIVFNFFVFWWCIDTCCCRLCCYCCGKDKQSNKNKKNRDHNSKKDRKKELSKHNSEGISYRSSLYTGITFTFSWLYFIGAIFLVPYTAQMCLNSLATATAVAIFIKRKELSIKHFRILTGVFTPMVMFMSAYAAWNLRDTISEKTLEESPNLKLSGLALFIAFIDGIWIVLATIYVIIIDDEIITFYKQIKRNRNKVNSVASELDSDHGRTSTQQPKSKLQQKQRKEVSLQWVGRLVGKFGPISGQFGSFVYLTHISFGLVYIIACIIFTRANEMFLLEVVSYCIVLVLGAIGYQYYVNVNTCNLAAIESCTQLLILFLGISGTRVCYALLGGFDFGNIWILPGRIIAATFLCWFFLFYRTLEVIEWNFSDDHANGSFID